MCDPVTIMAGVSLATSAVGVGMQAYGANQQGKAAQQQARLNAAQQEMQAQLASYNADQAEMFGKINSDLTLAVAGLNNKMTGVVADANTSIIGATTDFNVGVIKATTDFNVSSAEGAAQLLAAQGDLQGQVHANNATLLELSAQDALGQGAQQERVSRGQYAQLKSSQRAALAANGVALDEGSALRIQSDTDYLSDQDATTIRANATKAALGYRIQGANETLASKMSSLSGKAQALDKRMEAVQSRIQGETAATQATVDGALKALDVKMSSTFQLLTTDMNAQVTAFNTTNQAKADAWAMRAQALGYQGQAAQSRLQASAIKPGLMAATSLVSGIGQIGMSAVSMANAGTFSRGGGAALPPY